MHTKLATTEVDRPSALQLATRLRGAIQARDLLEADELFAMFNRHFVSRVHKTPLFHIDEFSVLQGVRRRAKARVRKDRRLGLLTQATVISSLVAFARVRDRAEVCAVVRDLHRSFLLRFHDPIYGGLFEGVDLESGAPRGGKTWEPILDVACDYLIDVSELEATRDLGGHVLEEAAMIACDVSSQRADGAIFELTIADRRPKWRDWQPRSAEVSRLVFTAPKTAHLLLAAYKRFRREIFAEAAIDALSRALDRAFDWDSGRWSTIPRAGAARIGFWSGDSERERQAQALRVLTEAEELGLLDRITAARGSGRDALAKTVARAPHPLDAQ
jgi:hypothetical protein